MTFDINKRKTRHDMKGHNMTFKYEMTRRLDKVKANKVRGPNSKLVTNEFEAQNENTVARTKLDIYTTKLVMVFFCFFYLEGGKGCYEVGT